MPPTMLPILLCVPCPLALAAQHQAHTIADPTLPWVARAPEVNGLFGRRVIQLLLLDQLLAITPAPEAFEAASALAHAAHLGLLAQPAVQSRAHSTNDSAAHNDVLQRLPCG
eukprot:CAMPEP_0202858078 /NCGR_PEP_ID=MMETSP1391-20130828/759_1 /ASSEMBLY_ACC=CAM_ASM_000867 /TAXON_ID=1034604 /ORGANISM="Chlamydomonas leiostraca, Strain SAG 11-49" /LENGTH=111 /DNA_ID=CAMNT_0049536951 /DNA_START=173 /DNA_END=508 /DNA_ORIENTATION=+